MLLLPRLNFVSNGYCSLSVFEFVFFFFLKKTIEGNRCVCVERKRSRFFVSPSRSLTGRQTTSIAFISFARLLSTAVQTGACGLEGSETLLHSAAPVLLKTRLYCSLFISRTTLFYSLPDSGGPHPSLQCTAYL